MLFEFIKYINPSWYFNLQPPKREKYYFLDYDSFSDSEKSIISVDKNYSSWEISKNDAAYQAFQKGLISKSIPPLSCAYDNCSLQDKYRFVKKYFHKFWVYIIFFARIFSLHNPIKELKALIKTLRVKRINIYEKVVPQPHFDNFVSGIVNSKPFVSVIIPTLNRYEYLRDVLSDLEKQVYSYFEVIIIDQSEPFNNSFYNDTILDLKVEYQQEKALWLARNKAIKMAKGNYVLLYDDDSRVDENWILNHLKCLDYYNADISSGVSLSTIGAKIPKHYSFFRWSDQLDTGNVMIKKSVFSSIGLFDRQFEKQRQGDGEFGLRAYLFGFQNISNPKSSRVHLKVSEGGLRQMGSWDGFRPKNFFAPRPIPSVLYFLRKYFGNKAALYSLIIRVPPSLLPYRFKKNKFIFLGGIFLSIIAAPVIVWSVVRSWLRAGKMLREGAKIEFTDFPKEQYSIHKA